MRARLCRASTIAVAATLATSSCGILDAVFGASLLTDDEICDQAKNLEATREQTCDAAGHERAPPCDVFECIRESAGCDGERDALFECIFDGGHECSELTPPSRGYCDDELVAALDKCATDCRSPCATGQNGVCELGEGDLCPDCADAVCDHDGVCDAEESPRCDDCGAPCASNDECAIGEICSNLNGLLCDVGGAPNCDAALPTSPTCQRGCGDGDDCDLDEGCMEVGPNDDIRERACERRTCENDGDCNDSTRLCVDPIALAPGSAGLCLPQECNPASCAYGDPPDLCGCDDVLGHCAPMRGPVGDVVVYVCTVAGDRGVGDECDIDADCGNDLACDGGRCRFYCHDDESCDDGACQVLSDGQLKVCIPG